MLGGIAGAGHCMPPAGQPLPPQCQSVQNNCSAARVTSSARLRCCPAHHLCRFSSDGWKPPPLMEVANRSASMDSTVARRGGRMGRDWDQSWAGRATAGSTRGKEAGSEYCLSAAMLRSHHADRPHAQHPHATLTLASRTCDLEAALLERVGAAGSGGPGGDSQRAQPIIGNQADGQGGGVLRGETTAGAAGQGVRCGTDREPSIAAGRLGRLSLLLLPASSQEAWLRFPDNCCHVSQPQSHSIG